MGRLPWGRSAGTEIAADGRPVAWGRERNPAADRVLRIARLRRIPSLNAAALFGFSSETGAKGSKLIFYVADSTIAAGAEALVVISEFSIG